jgi:hypothetical protein
MAAVIRRQSSLNVVTIRCLDRSTAGDAMMSSHEQPGGIAHAALSEPDLNGRKITVCVGRMSPPAQRKLIGLFAETHSWLKFRPRMRPRGHNADAPSISVLQTQARLTMGTSLNRCPLRGLNRCPPYVAASLPSMHGRIADHLRACSHFG